MNTNSVSMQVLDTVRQHLPAGAEWAPLAIGCAVALAGLIFLLRGARMAPALAASFFLALGCLVGPVVAAKTGLPSLPALIVCGTLGLVLGIVLFRLWFAVLIGLTVMIVSLGFYAAQTVLPTIEEFHARGLQARDGALLVTLPDATPAEAAATFFPSELATFLHEKHPNLNLNALVIAIASGAAGLFFALLLPKTSRSIWAATVGTALFLPAAYFVLASTWEPGADWIGRRPAVIAAALWSLSLLVNLADVLGWRRKRAPAAAATA